MADSATPHGRVSGGRRGLLAGSGAVARFGRFAGALTHGRNARLEARRREEVERTRAAERRRIAGELHDVLAHRLSLLSLQAGALELRPDAPPDEAAQCAAIRTSAATAFEELRDVMAVLGEDADEWRRLPQPTLGCLPALLEEARSAGIEVRAHVDVPGAGLLPDALGRTAYRVVEEGLRSAREHSPGAPVEVTVSASAGACVTVEVASRRSAATGPADRLDVGLIGLSERLALVGGRLEHGPDAQGRSVIRATLPWTP